MHRKKDLGCVYADLKRPWWMAGAVTADDRALGDGSRRDP